jgi:hypothetical protein
MWKPVSAACMLWTSMAQGMEIQVTFRYWLQYWHGQNFSFNTVAESVRLRI